MAHRHLKFEQLCILEPCDPSRCFCIPLAFWLVVACSSLPADFYGVSKHRCRSEGPTFHSAASSHLQWLLPVIAARVKVVSLEWSGVFDYQWRDVLLQTKPHAVLIINLPLGAIYLLPVNEILVETSLDWVALRVLIFIGFTRSDLYKNTNFHSTNSDWLKY